MTRPWGTVIGGRPAPCFLFGVAMLGTPALALAASGHPGPRTAGPPVPLVAVILAVGAGLALGAIARPERPALAPSAVVCAVGAFVFVQASPWADGLAGVAALGFLLSARLHAESKASHVDTGEWISAHRPMLEGAAVTAPAAVAAILVPSAWSYPVAGLVALGIAGVCASMTAASG